MPDLPTRAKPCQTTPSIAPAQNEATPPLLPVPLRLCVLCVIPRRRNKFSRAGAKRTQTYPFTRTYSRSIFPSFAVQKKYPFRGSKSWFARWNEQHVFVVSSASPHGRSVLEWK
jgi:hypothetical protein